MTKILIIAPSWVGDSVMAQPLFMRLKQHFPDVLIDVYAPPWVAPVLARMPEVNAVIPNPFGHGELRLLDRLRAARKLRRQGYDQAIVLPNSLKSALIPWLAGIPRRTGFVGEMRYGLLNDARELDAQAYPLMVERFALLAESAPQARHYLLPKPKLSADDARQRTTLAQLGLTLEQPVVACCVGAEYGPAKRWPEAHFAALANTLHLRGFQVWLIGSVKDQAIGEAIQRASAGAARNLCGATSLDQAIDLLACARAVVSNDSGLMHIAAALGKPLVALYGSSSPDFTPPLSDRARILNLHLPCSPCFKRECPLGHFDCMMTLAPPRVLDALAELNLF